MSKGVVSIQGSEVIVKGGDGKYTRQHTTLVKVFPTTPDTCQPNPDVSVSSDSRAGCSTTMALRRSSSILRQPPVRFGDGSVHGDGFDVKCDMNPLFSISLL